MIEYFVVTAEDEAVLSRKVCVMLSKSWVLVGGASVFYNGRLCVFVQALTRTKCGHPADLGPL